MLSKQLCSKMVSFRTLSTKVAAVTKQPQHNVFPRETEGNVYDVNFSLLNDGVVSTGDSFRNARTSLLTSRLTVKPANGIVIVDSLKLDGKFKLVESGDNISHEEFAILKREQDDILSSGADLFVEDASVGASVTSRVGTRVVTQNAATALAFRKLMMATPSKPVNHAARFDGWENDDRFRVASTTWTGSEYTFSDRPQQSKGERPVAAFIGGEHDTLAVQFVESNGNIVGGNVVAGNLVPLRGVVEGMNLAATVLINAQHADKIALPSTTFSGKSTIAVVNAPDDIISQVKGTVHGAYGNVFSTEGVSAMWGGRIAAGNPTEPVDSFFADVPTVTANKFCVQSVEPVNMASPAESIFIFDSAATKKSEISGDAMVAKISEVMGDSESSKADAIKAIFGKSKVYVVNKAQDIVV